MKEKEPENARIIQEAGELEAARARLETDFCAMEQAIVASQAAMGKEKPLLFIKPFHNAVNFLVTNAQHAIDVLGADQYQFTPPGSKSFKTRIQEGLAHCLELVEQGSTYSSKFAQKKEASEDWEYCKKELTQLKTALCPEQKLPEQKLGDREQKVEKKAEPSFPTPTGTSYVPRGPGVNKTYVDFIPFSPVSISAINNVLRRELKLYHSSRKTNDNSYWRDKLYTPGMFGSVFCLSENKRNGFKTSVKVQGVEQLFRVVVNLAGDEVKLSEIHHSLRDQKESFACLRKYDSSIQGGNNEIFHQGDLGKLISFCLQLPVLLQALYHYRNDYLNEYAKWGFLSPSGYEDTCRARIPFVQKLILNFELLLGRSTSTRMEEFTSSDKRDLLSSPIGHLFKPHLDYIEKICSYKLQSAKQEMPRSDEAQSRSPSF